MAIAFENPVTTVFGNKRVFSGIVQLSGGVGSGQVETSLSTVENVDLTYNQPFAIIPPSYTVNGSVVTVIGDNDSRISFRATGL